MKRILVGLFTVILLMSDGCNSTQIVSTENQFNLPDTDETNIISEGRSEFVQYEGNLYWAEDNSVMTYDPEHEKSSVLYITYREEISRIVDAKDNKLYISELDGDDLIYSYIDLSDGKKHEMLTVSGDQRIIKKYEYYDGICLHAYKSKDAMERALEGFDEYWENNLRKDAEKKAQAELVAYKKDHPDKSDEIYDMQYQIIIHEKEEIAKSQYQTDHFVDSDEYYYFNVLDYYFVYDGDIYYNCREKNSCGEYHRALCKFNINTKINEMVCFMPKDIESREYLFMFRDVGSLYFKKDYWAQVFDIYKTDLDGKNEVQLYGSGEDRWYGDSLNTYLFDGNIYFALPKGMYTTPSDYYYAYYYNLYSLKSDGSQPASVLVKDISDFNVNSDGIYYIPFNGFDIYSGFGNGKIHNSYAEGEFNIYTSFKGNINKINADGTQSVIFKNDSICPRGNIFVLDNDIYVKSAFYDADNNLRVEYCRLFSSDNSYTVIGGSKK